MAHFQPRKQNLDSLLAVTLPCKNAKKIFFNHNHSSFYYENQLRSQSIDTLNLLLYVF